MKLDERYDVRVIVYEYNNGRYGDCYISFEKLKKRKTISRI